MPIMRFWLEVCVDAELFTGQDLTTACWFANIVNVVYALCEDQSMLAMVCMRASASSGIRHA